MELECVFFSETPSSGSRSRISWALTSNSRASSLMRIFLINSNLRNYGVGRLSTAFLPRDVIAWKTLPRGFRVVVNRGSRVFYPTKLIKLLCFYKSLKNLFRALGIVERTRG